MPAAPWTPTAFEDVFHTYRTPLVRYVAGVVGDGAVAHDLVQDVFADLWADGHDPDRPVRPLLYAMARNRALNHVRNRRSREAKHDQVARGAPHAEAPTDALDARALSDRLAGWIRALPPRQREALTLTRFHHLPHDEAAQTMGLSPRTVNNHVVRALATLRERIDAYDPAPR